MSAFDVSDQTVQAPGVVTPELISASTLVAEPACLTVSLFQRGSGQNSFVCGLSCFCWDVCAWVHFTCIFLDTYCYVSRKNSYLPDVLDSYVLCWLVLWSSLSPVMWIILKKGMWPHNSHGRSVDGVPVQDGGKHQQAGITLTPIWMNPVTQQCTQFKSSVHFPEMERTFGANMRLILKKFHR